MVSSNPVWEICEHVAEVQTLLDDHVAGGVLSEAGLLRAMFNVGYFPPNTPPPADTRPPMWLRRRKPLF
jgi:hypothetical protein